ncbi:MAG: ABC transporter ATP-binding protein [Acidimicrobiia bacterium]|nr:MAG: ABC transporter ATP-binding protein [Acidimicrobiia bacterium]
MRRIHGTEQKPCASTSVELTSTDGIGIEAKVNEPLIVAEELTKIYGEGVTATRALDGVSFTIDSGEFVVLLGPSGSGKTTLLNQIGALEPATSGSLQVDGEEIAGMSDKERTEYRRSTVGFVFQFYNLVPTLTAHENVALIAEITGANPEQRSETVLANVGLTDRVGHFPGEMSGGQQQRVAIARGIVKNPPLLLCDEPTGSLDLETGRTILELLKTTTEGEDRTVFLVTHNSTIAEMADRVIKLRDGKIVSDEINRSPTPAAELRW